MDHSVCVVQIFTYTYKVKKKKKAILIELSQVNLGM